VRFGIVTALLPEAACLTPRPECDTLLRLSDETVLYVSGMGAARARQGAERLLADGARALISLGTAGALAGGLDAGAVILPERILRGDGGQHIVHAGWRAAAAAALPARGIPVVGGALLHADHVIGSAAEKRALHEGSGAAAADMESGALAELADARDVPFLALRVIVDGAGIAIPASALAGADAYGRTRAGALLLSLLRRPADLPALLRLAGDWRAAARRLRLLAGCLDALQPPA